MSPRNVLAIRIREYWTPRSSTKVGSSSNESSTKEDTAIAIRQTLPSRNGSAARVTTPAITPACASDRKILSRPHSGLGRADIVAVRVALDHHLQLVDAREQGVQAGTEEVRHERGLEVRTIRGQVRPTTGDDLTRHAHHHRVGGALPHRRALSAAADLLGCRRHFHAAPCPPAP